MIQVLQEDLASIEGILRDNKGQFWRRVYARAIFAFVDGVLFSLKVGILPPSPHPLLESEREYLYGRRAKEELDGHKLFDLTPTRVSVREDFEMTFFMYADMWGSNFRIRKNTKGWDLFLEAIRIRKRVTHPKRLRDLDITNGDLEALHKALHWFMRNHVSLLESSVKATKEMLKGMSRAFRKKSIKSNERDKGQLKLLES